MSLIGKERGVALMSSTIKSLHERSMEKMDKYLDILANTSNRNNQPQTMQSGNDSNTSKCSKDIQVKLIKLVRQMMASEEIAQGSPLRQTLLELMDILIECIA